MTRKILFKISRYRKYKPNKFNPKLSNYWSDMYDDMFKKW